LKFFNEYFLNLLSLKNVLAQLTNAEIARLDVVTRARTRDLTVVYEFIFSGLPLHLRQKKKSRKHSLAMLRERKTISSMNELIVYEILCRTFKDKK